MSKYYEKDVGRGEKLLYDSSGKCVGRGVTDKYGRTIYSGKGGYMGKSYETGHGTVKYFDTDNNYVGGGIKRSGVSSIHSSSAAAPSVGTSETAIGFGSGSAAADSGNSTARRYESFEYNGENHKLPAYVTLNDAGKKNLYTDLTYAVLEECRENERGQILYRYRITNRLGYSMCQETRRKPDELIAELGIDYRKAKVGELMKYPPKEREFHLMMYDSVINDRPPEYYLKQQKKQHRENALVIAILCFLGLSILAWLFV